MTQRKIFRPWDSADEDRNKISDSVSPIVTTAVSTPPVTIGPASPSLYSLNLWTSFFLPPDHQPSLHSHRPPSFFFPSSRLPHHHVHHHHHPFISSAFTHIGSLSHSHASSRHHPSLRHPSSLTAPDHSVNGSNRHERLIDASATIARSEAAIPGQVSSSSSERSSRPKRQRPKRFHCPHCQIAFSEYLSFSQIRKGHCNKCNQAIRDSCGDTCGPTRGRGRSCATIPRAARALPETRS